jgi:hypothetical protein
MIQSSLFLLESRILHLSHAANELLPNIPKSEYTKVVRFLESQGFKEEAFVVTTNPDHKFDCRHHHPQRIDVRKSHIATNCLEGHFCWPRRQVKA